MNFGILTLATPHDYLKAIGLALSLRVSNPGVKVAVACSNEVRPLVEPYFDYVVEEDPELRGFEHKVNLDRYSPFDETLFFDSDILVFRPVKPFIEKWGPGAYVACGSYVVAGMSDFGMDRAAVRNALGKKKFVKIEGAGHGLFRKPACFDVFDKAREVTSNYRGYVGNVKYADEDAISIVMTMLDLPPVPHGEFFSRHISAKKGTMVMNVLAGKCKFIAADTGLPFEPCIMHFAANEAPVFYTKQLWRLFNHFKVPTRGLLRLGWRSFYRVEIKDPLHRFRLRLMRLITRN
jgi:hypothetical protein